MLKKELKDPSVEKVHGWDITGNGSRATWDTQRTRHRKVNSHHASPCKAPHASHSMLKQALRNFSGVFYQGCEMHLHLHPPSTASPSSPDINSDHCQFPPCIKKGRTRGPDKGSREVLSQRGKRLLSSPSDVCFRLIQILLRGQQEIRGNSWDTLHCVLVLKALLCGVEPGPV